MGLTVNTTPGEALTGSKMAMPGWFHANITQIKETEKCNGIEIHGSVLAGKPNDSTVTEFVDISFKFTLWYPDASKSEDQQLRTNAKLTAFLIASDLVSPAQLGQPISVDEQLAVGRHVIVHLAYARKKEGDKWVDNPPFVELAFNDILHIDDPVGKDVPKNIAALKFVPEACRHPDPKYFAFKAKPSAAAAGGGSQTGAGSTVAAGAVAKF